LGEFFVKASFGIEAFELVVVEVDKVHMGCQFGVNSGDGMVDLLGLRRGQWGAPGGSNAIHTGDRLHVN
jgi:hypothetical protein